MPVTDPEPGRELQVDFAKMGLLPAGEHKKTCYALIFAACSSRHCYIWLTFHQTTEEVINGFEEAWRFFGGIFPVVIPDYVPRNIIGVLCPGALCCPVAQGPPKWPWGRG